MLERTDEKIVVAEADLNVRGKEQTWRQNRPFRVLSTNPGDMIANLEEI